MQPSRLETGLAGKGTFRWVATDLTLVLEEARRRLDLSPLASVALGQALAGAVLLQRLAFKVPARLIVEVRGDGPLGSVRAEAEHTGRVRGTVANPRVEVSGDAFRLAPVIGKGTLFVTRETKGPRAARHTSRVALVSGELGDDIAHYLEQSRQIRSAVLLGVLPIPTGVGAAGGLIVEALPGTEPADLERLERNIHGLEGVSGYLSGGGVARLLGAVFEGLDPEHLAHQELEYFCRCDRTRLLGYLQGLGSEELEDLAEESGTFEAVCSFCGSRYVYEPSELVDQPTSAL